MRYLFGAVIGALVLAACGGSGDGTEAATTTATENTLPAMSVDLPGCTPAPASVVTEIEAGLTGDAVAVRLAYVDEDQSSRAYVGGSIYRDDGFRVSSADTWLIEDGTIYALSGSANEYSDFPDGRDLPDRPSAGDERGQALQDQCSIPAIAG